MELLDERPIELMNEHELVAALDQNHAALAYHETRHLRLLAALDATGHAERIGARDTVQFIEYRYRLDHHRARRDLQLARALPKYAAVTAALPDVTSERASEGRRRQRGCRRGAGRGSRCR